MPDQVEERTLKQAKLDAQYGELFHALNARLWWRVHKCMLAAKLLSGCAAFALLIEGLPSWLKLAGALFISVTVIFDAVWQPLEGRYRHREFIARYSELLERSDLTTVEAFDRALSAIHDREVGVAALAMVAYNKWPPKLMSG